MHKPIAAAISLILALVCPGGEITYTNPLWDGSLADPHAFKVGDTYCAVGTGKAPHMIEVQAISQTLFISLFPRPEVLPHEKGVMAGHSIDHQGDRGIAPEGLGVGT